MLNLVPYPSKEAAETGGSIVLPKKIGFDCGKFSNESAHIFCHRTGIEFADGNFAILKKNEQLEDEEYFLKITANGILIEASTDKGAVWALTTIVQLCHDGEIPCCIIKDAPKYSHRGLSLDCARHFFTAGEVKKIIEEISLIKMNVLHWHLTDDQGWRIESKKFPRLQEKSIEFYTQAEIKDICEFARLRGVEIIPEIDMPGHVSALLSAYPEYSCRGEDVEIKTNGGIFPVVLCPGKEKTYAFLEELIDEIIPLFPGKRFHIGGDETPKREWGNCIECKRKIKENNLKDAEELQGYFSRRINEIIKKHGRTAILWNESLRAGNIDNDVEIQYWTLQLKRSMMNFVDKGGKWIYSDMFDIYFDYPYSMTPMEKVYSMKFHLGRKDVRESKNLLGAEAAIWGEHIKTEKRLEELLFPRIYALAEITWCGERDYNEFLKRTENLISKRKYISFTPRYWWDPRGKERRREAVEYMAEMNSDMGDGGMAGAAEAAAPNTEFAMSFVTKFFKVSDLPALLKTMLKK